MGEGERSDAVHVNNGSEARTSFRSLAHARRRPKPSGSLPPFLRTTACSLRPINDALPPASRYSPLHHDGSLRQCHASSDISRPRGKQFDGPVGHYLRSVAVVPDELSLTSCERDETDGERNDPGREKGRDKEGSAGQPPTVDGPEWDEEADEPYFWRTRGQGWDRRIEVGEVAEEEEVPDVSED
jgi:hypothetical protein